MPKPTNGQGLAVALSLLAGLSAAPARADFDGCLAGLRAQASAAGISGRAFEAATAGIAYDDKVIERYHKSIALMTPACEVADRAYIFDNSGSRHKLLAEITDYQTIELASSLINPWLLRTDLWKAFT